MGASDCQGCKEEMWSDLMHINCHRARLLPGPLKHYLAFANLLALYTPLYTLCSVWCLRFRAYAHNKMVCMHALHRTAFNKMVFQRKMRFCSERDTPIIMCAMCTHLMNECACAHLQSLWATHTHLLMLKRFARDQRFNLSIRSSVVCTAM